VLPINVRAVLLLGESVLRIQVVCENITPHSNRGGKVVDLPLFVELVGFVGDGGVVGKEGMRRGGVF
jgi:hypothetical protein